MNQIFRILIFVIFSAGVLVFQNCAKAVDASSTGVDVVCSPANKPCLSYKLSISNWKSTKNGMGILFQCAVNEGCAPSNSTSFTGPCSLMESTLALCSFNSDISATATSRATGQTVNGDGRSVSFKFTTAESFTAGIKQGTMTKVADGNTATNMCVVSSGVNQFGNHTAHLVPCNDQWQPIDPNAQPEEDLPVSKQVTDEAS